MDKYREFEEALKKTKILRPVRQKLYTFSSTDVDYYLTTELIKDTLIEVREGKVIVEKPLVINPFSSFAKKQFDGFDENQFDYLQMLFQKYGLRALEYTYKNETKKVNLISGHLNSILDKINKDIDRKEKGRATIIKGIPEMWTVSLMKCVMEIIVKSFPDNVNELQERGWFEEYNFLASY